MQLSLTNSKMSYLMKKLLDTMKRIQSKKHKLGIFEIDKISSLCFGDKRCVSDDGICALAYFHKNSVTSCQEIKKDCDKKDWD